MPYLRRLLGAALLLSAYAPIHRLLDPAATGPAGAATRAAAEAAWTVGISGTLIVVTFAWVCVRMVPRGRLPIRWSETAVRWLTTPTPATFAIGIGVVTASLAGILAIAVHGGSPTSVDEMAQLLHARAIVSGRMTIPFEGPAAAWTIQNGIGVQGGWASIYPPVHTLLLAAGLAGGLAWLVGPVAIGVATAATVSAGERLIGSTPARAVGLLLAVSPFWLLVGSTHLSHATAAAGLALVLYTGVRATRGSLVWAVATGVALGFAIGARPWVGLSSGAAILLVLWWPGTQTEELSAGAQLRRLGAMCLGGLPFAGLLFWWNARLFEHPLQLGYSAAFGPSHGLGFGVDPWGNLYGAVEAMGYTGGDLTMLGLKLFESPIPTLAFIGAVLIVRPLPRGVTVFAAWAAAAVLANAAYWHHGIHMGPRMLIESTPAWIALFAVSGVVILRPGASRLGAWSLSVAMLAAWALSIGAVRNQMTPGAVMLPDPPVDTAIVFVHGSWASRIAARLGSDGMRKDSIETALRRNDVCAVDRYTRWRTAGDPAADPPPLDLDPVSGSPASLETRSLSPGNLVRVEPGVVVDASCLREARSDRLGVLELELVAWQGPPLPGVEVVFARDLGPVGNIAVLEAVERPAFVYVDRGSEDEALLLDYAAGMELLWGGAAREGIGSVR
jgi:hypothetical protein